MTRRTLAVLATFLMGSPALAQTSGSMGTGTSSSDSTGLQTSVPNAVHDQTSSSSVNTPPGQAMTSTSGSTDTGTSSNNKTGAQTSLPSAIQNQSPAGSSAAH